MLRNHLKAVFGPDGYATSSLSSGDLAFFQNIVQQHYLSVLKGKGGVTDAALLEQPIYKYHSISDRVDHGGLWCKNNRILPKADYDAFLTADFFKDLQDVVGDVLISDEENIGYPEIYWRLVRPPPHHDVGPLHADAWFWNLGHGDTPEGYQRIKFWFSLWNDEGQNGFRFVPGSHLKDYPYKGKERDGFVKPSFNEDDHDLDVNIFRSTPGDFIIFNDKLLHGGAVGGDNTRVSFEFTLFVSDQFVDGLCAE